MKSRVVQPPPKLFLDKEDKTDEVLTTFECIESCVYSAENLGDASHEFMECDCAEEYVTDEDGERVNAACGENSDCINRLTLIECVNGLCDSTCGRNCQNQRFQKRQYADVSVFLTERKGYGVRANQAIAANEFIYEYIGEVIDESSFKERMLEYDRQHLKHFYFMMLQNGQFIDATRKGSLARFCNHSCNPNAFVNKWVVNGKLRMGIFALRDIIKGEEITFDYNVDRYGAAAQKCYCGEPNCIGFLGGKTQTEAISLLPQSYSDALGISRSVEKRWIKLKKARGEPISSPEGSGIENINREFVKSLEIFPCETVDDVTAVMSVLLHCADKLIASRLLERLFLIDSSTTTRGKWNEEEEELTSGDSEEGDLEKSRIVNTLYYQIIKLHGYKCLAKVMQTFDTDESVLENVLRFLLRLPRTTRNGIDSSHIDEIVKNISEIHPALRKLCDDLTSRWKTYETYTRITKRDTSGAQPSIITSKLKDLRRIRLPPGWEVIQENGRPIYYNAEQKRKLVDPPVNFNGFGRKSNNPEATDRWNPRRRHHSPFDRSRPYGVKRTFSSYNSHNRERGARDGVDEEGRIRNPSRFSKKPRVSPETTNVNLSEHEKEKDDMHSSREEFRKEKMLEEIIARASEEKRLERERSKSQMSNQYGEPSYAGSSPYVQGTLHTTSLEHRWNKFFAAIVPNMVQKYNLARVPPSVQLSHDRVKQCAKDIVSILTSKEMKRDKNHEPPEKLDKHKNEKIRVFVDGYMDKFVAKYVDGASHR